MSHGADLPLVGSDMPSEELARCLRPIVALPMQWNSMVQRTEHFGLRRLGQWVSSAAEVPR